MGSHDLSNCSDVFWVMSNILSFRNYHGKFCIDKFSILNWANFVSEKTLNYFFIKISQYIKTKPHDKSVVIILFI